MKLIALIVSLVLEHAATRRLRLRELRWFDPYFDFALRRVKGSGRASAVAVLALFIGVALLPVLWASLVLEETFIFWDLPYLAFAVLIVFLCLGPRDLAAEVDDYCAALDGGNEQRAQRVLTELTESHESPLERDVVEEAIFVQAMNRIFGVVFWFIVFGPVGAWLFRVSDLLRRRAAFESQRNAEIGDAGRRAAEFLHAVLAFVPARLAALGYALAGSFDEAINRWRSAGPADGSPLRGGNERVVAGVGKGAMSGFLAQPPNSSAAARNAMRLVMRTLFIWITVISLMTIFGWAV